MLAHWDEVERHRLEQGPLASHVQVLGRAAGSKKLGVSRWIVDPGKRSTPVHVELAEEEIFYVLGGSGLVWLNERTHEVRAGDCIVCLPMEHDHTFVAGDDGLDLLAFSQLFHHAGAYLPRAGLVRIDPAWVAALPESGPTPWEREVAAGELELPEPSERPANVVNVDDVEGDYGGLWKGLAGAAGSDRTGMNWAHLPPGEWGAPAHCHSVEEEIFVVLEGEGTLGLWPSPQQARRGREYEELPIRAGHVISRPAGTGIAHGIAGGGDDGVTFLAYGMRDRADVAYYPNSNKIFFRGVGVIARLEDLDYLDGEPGE